jgi:hypothetical protein
MKSKLEAAFAEAKLPANKRSKDQQKKYVEFWESKRVENLSKSKQNEQ